MEIETKKELENGIRSWEKMEEVIQTGTVEKKGENH
jgi:hypothetical protein